MVAHLVASGRLLGQYGLFQADPTTWGVMGICWLRLSTVDLPRVQVLFHRGKEP